MDIDRVVYIKMQMPQNCVGIASPSQLDSVFWTSFHNVLPSIFTLPNRDPLNHPYGVFTKWWNLPPPSFEISLHTSIIESSPYWYLASSVCAIVLSRWYQPLQARSLYRSSMGMPRIDETRTRSAKSNHCWKESRECSDNANLHARRTSQIQYVAMLWKRISTRGSRLRYSSLFEQSLWLLRFSITQAIEKLDQEK